GLFLGGEPHASASAVDTMRAKRPSSTSSVRSRISCADTSRPERDKRPHLVASGTTLPAVRQTHTGQKRTRASGVYPGAGTWAYTSPRSASLRENNDSLGGVHAAAPEAKERRSAMARPVEPGRHTHRVGRRSAATADSNLRSEEHTSELQSRGHLVCRLLLEKKK